MLYRVDYSKHQPFRPLISLQVGNPDGSAAIVLPEVLADTGATSVTLTVDTALKIGLKPTPIFYQSGKAAVLIWRGCPWKWLKAQCELTLLAQSGERLIWLAEVAITDAPITSKGRFDAMFGQRGGLELFDASFCPQDKCLRLAPLADFFDASSHRGRVQIQP